ncbi:MAG: hypothetical protein GF355_14505 [Candidatus Eisenbacteria bacterium]|nr:hypothetical protein [Candidatus Eisenbacteria bacterium]
MRRAAADRIAALNLLCRNAIGDRPDLSTTPPPATDSSTLYPLSITNSRFGCPQSSQARGRPAGLGSFRAGVIFLNGRPAEVDDSSGVVLWKARQRGCRRYPRGLTSHHLTAVAHDLSRKVSGGAAVKRQAGFTMIEAIVIVGILAVLAGILTPLVIKEVSKSKMSRAMSDMEAVSTAFNQYYMDTAYWPPAWTGGNTTTEDFVGYPCLLSNSEDLPGWDGPYLERAVRTGGTNVVAYQNGNDYEGIVDPWGTPYRIFYGKKRSGAGGPGGAIAILCAGPDLEYDTRRAPCLRGEARDDDIVRVVTRQVN